MFRNSVSILPIFGCLILVGCIPVGNQGVLARAGLTANIDTGRTPASASSAPVPKVTPLPVVLPAPKVTPLPTKAPVPKPLPAPVPKAIPAPVPKPSPSPLPKPSPSVAPSSVPSVSDPTAKVCGIPALPAEHLNALDYGARGNGVVDDSEALQEAINDASAKKKVLYIPAGTYLLSLTGPKDIGLTMRSNLTIMMESKTILKVKPTAVSNYAVISIRDVSNVNLYGGVILGERDQHIGTDGEYGMGVRTLGATSKIKIAGMSSTRNWGDGFYLSSNDIEICGVISDSNRRNGLTLAEVNGVRIRSSRFTRTAGAAPEMGLDSEPNAGTVAENVEISDNVIEDNLGVGLAVTGTGGNARIGVSRNFKVLRNQISGSGDQGMIVRYDNHQIEDNIISGSKTNGLQFQFNTNTRALRNTVINSGSFGIIAGDGHSVTLDSNRVRGTGRDAIRLSVGLTESTAVRNICEDHGVLLLGGVKNTASLNVGCN